jgi:gliding motility-associated-like protein
MAPSAPTAPIAGLITQPSSCSAPTGSVELNGLPSSGTWTINPGGITGNGISTTIANLAPGTYNFTIYSDPGCISHASAAVVINPAPSAPTAPVVGTITQPSSCAATTGSVVLNGLPQTGTWTINPGAITGTGISTTISNLIPGTYNFSITAAAGCISNPSGDVVINAAPVAPTAPIVGTVTQPSSCGTPTGTVVLNGLPATGAWTINPGAITGIGTSTSITNLIPGTYHFNITTAAGCISLPSTDIVIISPPGTPASPGIGSITQPSSCASATGSVALNGLPALGIWTVNPGAITGTGTTTTITNLIPGTYHFTVTIASGCTSLASSAAVINAAPGAPIAPTVTIVHPTITVATGTITITSATAGLTFSLDGAAYIAYPAGGFTSVPAGTHTLAAQNAANCISSVTTITVNEQPSVSSFTYELSDFNGFNISCYGRSDGFIRIIVPVDLAPFTFLWNGPRGFTASTNYISGLSAGQYTALITDKNMHTTTETIVLTEPKQLRLIIDPSVSIDGTFNINCAGEKTGSVTLSALNNAGLVDYLWNDGFKGNTRTNLSAGIYRIIFTDSNNCQADSTFTLTEPDSLKLTLAITEPLCPDKADGEIRLTVSGGVPGTDYNYRWSDNSTGRNISNISAGSYKVTVADLNGCSISDSVQVNSANPTCLVIPNAISPNRDLINDVWNIKHIEQYPNVVITIYNNWGEVVWKSESGYPHPWDGRSNGAALPIDSYFYIIDLHNGSKPIGGSVTIIK